MITVLVVDDHPVVIEGLRKVLATAGDIDVTGEAYDASGAMERARALRPDVILLDLRLPGASGVQATRRLRELETRSAVIILTSYGDQAYVRQALEAGADGYLLKSTPPEHLIAAIRGAARGVQPHRTALHDEPLPQLSHSALRPVGAATTLLPDDLQILRRASEGATNREIALDLGRTETGVKKRLQVIFRTLDSVDRAQAVAVAIRTGLI